jgi:hypothetical protein
MNLFFDPDRDLHPRLTISPLVPLSTLSPPPPPSLPLLLEIIQQEITNKIKITRRRKAAIPNPNGIAHGPRSQAKIGQPYF